MSEPKRARLLELLRTSQGCQFVIPVYQRNYTWKANDQVKKYMFDLENVLKGNYKNHFLGIIIYLDNPLDFSSREFSVIDGQQRLTTTFLLIYAIRSILVQNKDEEGIKNLDGQYLTNPFSSAAVKYKLKPLVSDDDVYRCIVEDRMDDINNPNSNIFKNYNYISKIVNEWIKKGYSTNQILLALDKLYLVCVPILEDDNPQKIFESINATGAKLTSADLIRNYLLMDLNSTVQERYYAEYWKKIEENISSDSTILEMFFRMFIAIQTYSLVAKASVYREFVTWYEQSGLERESLLKDLLEYSKIYKYLFISEVTGYDTKLASALSDFRKYDSDLPKCAMMEFCKLFRKEYIDEETLGELIAAINSFLIRRSICDMNSQNISKLFPSVLKKVLEKCDDDYSNIIGILNQEMVGNTALTSGSYMPTDTQMHEMLYTANVYKRPSLRIILDRMELDGNPAPVDLSTLSIEHLMPQTPTEEWLEALDTDYETYQNNLHRIGNLTLATQPDNSRMGNEVWDYKNEVLRETGHLTLNMELLEIDHWDLNQIEERTTNMINRICSLYPYPDVTITEVDDDAIDENETLNVAIERIASQLETVKEGSAYKSADNRNGYVFAASKRYLQSDREKYWFAYREKRFEQLRDCQELNYVLICRRRDTLVIKLPKTFLDEVSDRLNVSEDEDGNVIHYHIVVFVNSNNSVSMLLSQPEREEIDISEFII